MHAEKSKTHVKDLQSMSLLGGLWEHQNNPACNETDMHNTHTPSPIIKLPTDGHTSCKLSWSSFFAFSASAFSSSCNCSVFFSSASTLFFAVCRQNRHQDIRSWRHQSQILNIPCQHVLQIWPFQYSESTLQIFTVWFLTTVWRISCLSAPQQSSVPRTFTLSESIQTKYISSLLLVNLSKPNIYQV